MPGTAIWAASINSGSDSLGTLAQHASEITSGVAKVSGGVADVGVSAFGAVTLVFSVMFLTLFGLIDETRLRGWVGGLLYRGDRERFLQVADRIVQTTSRYMLGNLAISVICGTVYGVTAVILDVPYPLALAVIAGILDLIPSIGATIAGIIVALAALSVSPAAFVVFLIVMVVYQQIENYILQPTIIGKAARISGFTVLASVLAFGALFGLIGAIIGVPIAAGIQIVVEELTAARRAAHRRRGRRLVGHEHGLKPSAQCEARSLRRCGCSSRPAGSVGGAADNAADDASFGEPQFGNCHPPYKGACLDPNASNYDCAGGSGDGPLYTGRVEVVGPDDFGLDRDETDRPALLDRSTRASRTSPP